MVLDDCAGDGGAVRRFHDVCAGVAEWESESGYEQLDVLVVVPVFLQYAVGLDTAVDIV